MGMYQDPQYGDVPGSTVWGCTRIHSMGMYQDPQYGDVGNYMDTVIMYYSVGILDACNWMLCLWWSDHG